MHAHPDRGVLSSATCDQMSVPITLTVGKPTPKLVSDRQYDSRQDTP